MTEVKNMLKGIVIGLGAVAPGLSGSVLLVLFGLYRKTINAISTIFKDFKNNLKFLIPLFGGIGVGVIIFSKIVDFFLKNYELPLCLTFLGLILGSIPLFLKEVKKEGFGKKYVVIIAVTFVLGAVAFFYFKNLGLFPELQDPNFLQSVFLGFIVAVSYIVPGVDSAAILSAFGLYKLWTESLADLNFSVLIPAVAGAGVGILSVSFIINKLLKKCYTGTFSVIFGLFLAIVTGVIYDDFVLMANSGADRFQVVLSVLLFVVGMLFSLFFSNIEKITDKIKEKKKKI